MKDISNRDLPEHFDAGTFAPSNRNQQLADFLNALASSNNPFEDEENFAPPSTEVDIEMLLPQDYYDRFRQILLDSAEQLAALASDMRAQEKPSQVYIRRRLSREFDQLRNYARAHFSIKSLTLPVVKCFPRLLGQFAHLATALSNLAEKEEQITADTLEILSEQCRSTVEKLSGGGQQTISFPIVDPVTGGFHQ